MTGAPFFELHGVSRSFERGPSRVDALANIDLSIAVGEFVSITGPSGSGKSTLLGLLGCLDRPSSGRLLLAGTDVTELSDESLSAMRNRSFGFVFQAFHLIPRLSVVENVETPLLYGTRDPSEWRQAALAALDRVGLSHRADHWPEELSGGEAQRAALARALVTAPTCVLADEPTGNLDSENGERVASLLEGLAGDGHTVILVTHDGEFARRAHRRIGLHDGRLSPG